MTTALGKAGINISDIHLGRSPAGEAALMVLATDEPVPTKVIDELRRTPGLLDVRAVGP